MNDAPRRMAAYRALTQATRHLNAAIEARVQAEAGVSLSELHILTALHEAPSHRARPGELGVMLGWEKSRISHQVTRMVGRLLVRRVECTEDQRGSFVELDAAGARAQTHGAAAFADEVDARLGHLDAARAAELAHALLELASRTAPSGCEEPLASIAAQAGATEGG